MNDDPLPRHTLFGKVAARSLAILRIFAARTWAEIERIRMQAALCEREEAYRDLYEEAPVAYVSVGRDGRIK